MKPPRRVLDGWMAYWRSLSTVTRRRVVRGGGLLLAAECLLLILTHEPFLIWFAYRFRAEDPPARSDAIVFLLGALDRSSKAADLYRRGVAPVILMSPTDGAWNETERHFQVLTSKGVPADAIRVLPGAVVQGTHDEALRVCEYVRAHPVRRVTVVTSAYHTARTRWAFRRALRDTGVEVRMAASDPHFTETDWFMHEDGIKLYACEIVKILYYRIMY